MLWGRSRRNKALVERFVAALNARDVDRLEPMLAEDFTYIDSWREGVTGRERVLGALRMLFASDPDFGMEVDHMDWRDPHVLMTGRINSQSFGMGRRAVWQVLIRDGLMAEFEAWAEGGPPPMSRMLAPDHVSNMADRAADKPRFDSEG